MRYYINFDKTINQFSPYYLSGRKLILYLQALMKPLQTLNISFVEWAKETQIEATMTSQIFKLEWFLNRKFKKYFLSSSQLISIKNGHRLGVPVFWQSADIPDNDNLLLKYESEGARSSTVLNYHDEITDENTCSFIVYSPQINTKLISTEEYAAMLSFYVNKYKISGKTFIVKFNL